MTRIKLLQNKQNNLILSGGYTYIYISIKITIVNVNFFYMKKCI